MALYSFTTGKVTLVPNTTRSLMLVNPGSADVKCRQVDISFDAQAASAGVQFDMYRVTTLGSPTGTIASAAASDERWNTSFSSALTSLTAEPTAVNVLGSYYLQPLGGLYTLPFPFGAEVIGKGGGNRIGIRYTAPPGVAPDCLVNFWFEE